MKIVRTDKEVIPFEELEIIDFDDFISKVNKKCSPYVFVKSCASQSMSDEIIESKVKTCNNDFNVTPISNIALCYRNNYPCFITYLARRNECQS